MGPHASGWKSKISLWMLMRNTTGHTKQFTRGPATPMIVAWGTRLFGVFALFPNCTKRVVTSSNMSGGSNSIWVSEWKSLSRVRLFATLYALESTIHATIVYLCRLYGPWNSPGQNTGVGGLSLLQGIFPTQGSNPGLSHCRRILYQLNYRGSPNSIWLIQHSRP